MSSKIYIKTARRGEQFHCQGSYVSNHEAARVKMTHDIRCKIGDGSVVVCNSDGTKISSKVKKSSKGDK